MKVYMQNLSLPSFFLTRMTALHHVLLLCLIAAASNILSLCFLTSSNNGGWDIPKSVLWRSNYQCFLFYASLRWYSPIHSYLMRMSWYSCIITQTFTVSSSGQSSSPVRSNYLRILACLWALVSGFYSISYSLFLI